MFALANVETHNLTFQSLRGRKEKPYIMDLMEVIRQTNMLDFPSTTVMGYKGYDKDAPDDGEVRPVTDFVGAYHETRNPAPEVTAFLEKAYGLCIEYPDLMVWLYKSSVLTVLHFVHWEES